jgi:DNA-binding MarR family transcriptional regulator
MSNREFRPEAASLTYALEPEVLVCADSEAGLEEGSRIVRAVGGRVVDALPIAGAVDRLDDMAPDAVLIDVRQDGGDSLDRLLDRLNLAAKTGRYRSVVALVPELIDIAEARAPHPDVVLLCGPSGIERAVELSVALAPRTGAMLAEGGAEPPAQLRQLSEEVGRIARALAALSQGEQPAETPFRPDASLPPSDPGAAMPTVASVRALLRARRLRDQYFKPDLFADPAWDMLLDLLLARLEGRLVAVSSLCIAAAVPPTTALRWIKRLNDEGLFVRTADPRDGRRVFIDLAVATAEALVAYLRALPRLGVSLA